MTWKTPPSKSLLSCIPAAISIYRRRLGLTQRELGERAGCTVRQVNKAENGHAIGSKTIESLANALSEPGKIVYPEDLVVDPIPLAKELIFGSYIFRDQTFNKIRHFLSEDVQLTFDGPPEEIPFAGVHRGLAEVERALGLFFELLEAPADCDYRSTHSFMVNQNNPNEVIVWGHSFFHAKGRPSPPMPIQLRMLFSRGELLNIDDRFDTEFAARQLGLA